MDWWTSLEEGEDTLPSTDLLKVYVKVIKFFITRYFCNFAKFSRIFGAELTEFGNLSIYLRGPPAAYLLGYQVLRAKFTPRKTGLKVDQRCPQKSLDPLNILCVYQGTTAMRFCVILKLADFQTRYCYSLNN